MQHYGTVVVVGGGCYGSYYVRQLERAAAAGAVRAHQVLVVDRDPECQLAVGLGQASATRHLPVVMAIREWSSFFRDYLGAATGDSDMASDAIVPSPLMPHLMYDWLLERAQSRWPERNVTTVALEREPAMPWQRAGAGGVHYVSFAEWMCPVNCVEPAMCPEIAGPRTWSMPPALRAYVAAEQARGRPLAGPAVLQCTHRVYGVGMFDTRDVLAADALIATAGETGAARVLVGTVSHCHGALSLMEIGEPVVAPAVGAGQG